MLFKKFVIVFFLTASFVGCKDIDHADLSNKLKAISNQISFSRIELDLKKLTGEQKFFLNGDSVVINSRHAENQGNKIAEQYIAEQLNKFNYKVERQNPFGSCINLIAQKQGSLEPEKYILIGAHYDSMPDYSSAPGADDNASGVVCVLEAARVFSNIETDYSILFAFWDEEEAPSPMGSEYYAEKAIEENINIVEVINIDMIAYDSNNDGDIVVNRTNFDGNENIEELLSIVNKTLALNLDIHYRKTYTRSDDRAFAKAGFNTIGFIEKYYNSSHHPKNDFNPDWHTTFDTLENFNWSYYKNNCKLIIGILWYLSRII